MIVIIAKVQINWGDAFRGYIPSKTIFSSGGIFTCADYDNRQLNMATLLTPRPLAVGIIGATVMPHSLFLGSALATQDRISFRASQEAGTCNTVSTKDTDDSFPNQPSEKVSCSRRLFEKSKKFVLVAFLKPPASTTATRYSERQNNPFEFVRAHIYHGMFDVVGSLLGFAVMINSLYVIRHFFSIDYLILCDHSGF